MKQILRRSVAPEPSGQTMPADRDAGESPAPAGRTTGKRWGRPPSPAETGKRRRPRQAAALRRLMSGVAVGELVRTPVRTVRSTTEVEDLATVFANSRASAVAVLDDDGVLRGVVTRDAVVRQTNSVWPEGSGEPAVVELELTAADLMDPEESTVGAETPLGLVVAIMVFSDLERVPVVQGADEAFLGLLTLGDVARWLAETSGYLR
jgi:CBS domain-containing protein